jgi:hypothetical protein
MPALILSSRFTSDSQILRRVAQRLGWETVRLERSRLPDWFEAPDFEIGLFYTAPHAFAVAQELSRSLLACDPAWITRLPSEALHRRVRLMKLREAQDLPGRWFVKHSVAKRFPASIYETPSLRAATSTLSPDTLVHVAEPVEWTREYRCFVLEGKVVAASAYRRDGRVVKGPGETLGATGAELDDARSFATSAMASQDNPPAFVLDVGTIRGQGWAVVEANECWASGIYACDPEPILHTLLRACVHKRCLAEHDRQWDFQEPYSAACP